MFSDPSEIVGTWTTDLHSNLDPFSDSVGQATLSFNSDHTFEEFFQLPNGEGESIGRYLFDGTTLQFIVDDFAPKTLDAPVPIAFGAVVATPVDFSPDGLQMALGGDIWNFSGVSATAIGTALAQSLPQFQPSFDETHSLSSILHLT
jgi:hypothetical protein